MQMLVNIAGMTAELIESGKLVRVVRCNDCKNACVYDDDEVICTHIDSNGNDKHPDDWFCADGVRKEH